MLKLHVESIPAPMIDPTETRWAASELGVLLRQIAPDSPTGQILQQARRELESLSRSVEGTVIGPFRMKVAA